MRSLDFGDVAELGYELVLGNTFHLFLAPGAERIAELGGLHRFTGWDRAIITDSGGFQVFSLAHGNVADEIKGRRGGSGSSGGVVEISERGVAFRSYLDGAEKFMGPEESMAVQAALASDIALAFDECTPYHADRDYTARSTERTHRWLDRCLAWHKRARPAASGAVRDRPGRGLRGPAPRIGVGASRAPTSTALAIGGTLGRDKPEMHGVLEMTAPMLPADAPKHLLGIGEPDDLLVGIGLGIDVFDCAVPTRLARHGMALAPLPDSRFRFDVARPRAREGDGAAGRRLPVPDLRRPQPRLPALPRPRRGAHRGPPADPPQPDLPQTLVTGAREAIEAQRFERLPRRPILAGRPHGRPSSHRARPDAEAQRKYPRRSRGQLIRARAEDVARVIPDVARVTACSAE